MGHAAVPRGSDDGPRPLLRLPGLAQTTFIIAAILMSAAIATAVTVRSGEPERPGLPSSLAGIPSEGQTIGRRDAPVAVTAWVDMTALGYNATIDRLLDVMPAVGRGEVSLTLEHWDVLGVEIPHAAFATLAAGEQGRYWPFAVLAAERFNPLYDEMRYLEPILTSVARDLDLDMGAWRAARQRWERRRSDLGVPPIRRADPLAGDEARSLGFAHPPAIRIQGPSGTATITGAPDAGELQAAIREVVRH